MKEHRSSLDKKVRWRGPEFLYKKKTPLWYTHVSVIFFIIIFALFIAENLIGIAVVALLFWFFLAKSNDKPKTVDYTISKDGITIDDRTMHYSEIHSFTVDVTARNPVIVLDLNYYFALPITLVAKPDNIDEVVEELMRYIPLRNEFSLIRWITNRLHY